MKTVGKINDFSTVVLLTDNRSAPLFQRFVLLRPLHEFGVHFFGAVRFDERFLTRIERAAEAESAAFDRTADAFKHGRKHIVGGKAPVFLYRLRRRQNRIDDKVEPAPLGVCTSDGTFVDNKIVMRCDEKIVIAHDDDGRIVPPRLAFHPADKIAHLLVGAADDVHNLPLIRVGAQREFLAVGKMRVDGEHT